MAPKLDIARSVSRRSTERPPIKWLEIAAGWALGVLLQLALLFLGFGLGAGAIDLRAAGEELRQQIASVVVGDRPDQRAFGQAAGTGAEPAYARAVSVLSDPPSRKNSRSISIESQVLDHAGPVVFWMGVWGALTWLASLFNNVPRSPSSAE